MPSQNYIHQQHATNFDMSSTVNGVGGGANNISNNEIMTNEFQSILLTEKDERFRYLIKHGTV
jgi:aspartyl-tRNA synthetase